MKSIPVVIALLVASLAANLLLWRRVSALETKVATATAPRSYPLGEMMGYLQRYADKLWFAGAAGNWDLAKFYRDEISETADDIAAAHVVDDGLAVSKLLAAQLPPAVDAVGQAIAAKDPAHFRARYEAMVNTCNACHVDAKHAFIHVAVPAGPPAHWNQSFVP